MLEQVSYTNYLSGEFPYLDLKKRILKIMGQFFDYLASVFVANPSQSGDKSGHHVTFAESSFSQSFGRGNQEQVNKLNSLRQSNKRTIFTYELISIIAFLLHFTMCWPKLQADNFDLTESQSWQLVLLNLLPFFVQIAAIRAMHDLNKPLPDGAKLSSKNSGLTLDNNEFVFSLKVIVFLMAFCQVSSVYSDSLLWCVVIVLPVWCFKLSARLACLEYDRHAPSPKKSWVKLNAPKSPKVVTPSKSAQQHSVRIDEQSKATPRTRTKKAVKSFLNNVSDKYHAFEQNVAQQISTRMNSPLGQAKMIDSR